MAGGEEGGVDRYQCCCWGVWGGVGQWSVLGRGSGGVVVMRIVVAG